MNTLKELRDYRKQQTALRWKGTFEEYLGIVKETPSVARLAVTRIRDMIIDRGVETGPGNHVRYNFFKDRMFGVDNELREIVEYLDASAHGLDVRKRILLLIGPPASGKSTLAILLKRGLETYSRTDEGRLYGLVGCPMHEEPLHVIPETLRESFQKELHVTIEGELCPVCQFRLDEEFEGDFERFEVERLLISEKRRLGIGTFTPGDPKSQDTSMLTGALDMAKIVEYGSESDPRAFRFDGEFNVANRGIIEFQEALKVSRDFLHALLSLAQEREIKTQRYAMLYADELILAHSNLAEFDAFLKNAENAAMKNRVVIVAVPYALNARDEEHIYEGMLKEALQDYQMAHLAPHTLHMAAMQAVLSRLHAPKDANLSLMDKLRLYQGERFKEYTDDRVEQLKKEAGQQGSGSEGMRGLSPRDTMNVLAYAMGESGGTCVNPIDMLKSFKYYAEAGKFLNYFEPEERKKLVEEGAMVRAEYDKIVKEVVMEAFVTGFPDAAKAMFHRYLDEAEAATQKSRIKDAVTGELREPDTKFLRSVEEQIAVSESAANGFREEILVRVGALSRKGAEVNWESHPRLAEAIRKLIFVDTRHLVKTTTARHIQDEDQKRRLDGAIEAMKQQGYCDICARATLNYAGTLLSNE